jgi:hypothetical protein
MPLATRPKMLIPILDAEVRSFVTAIRSFLTAAPDAVQQRILVTADAKIERFNTRIQKIYESLLSLHTAVLTKEQDLSRAPAERQLQKQQELEKKQQAFRKMLAQYDRLVPEGASLENSGSRQLSVLVFDRQIFHS